MLGVAEGPTALGAFVEEAVAKGRAERQELSEALSRESAETVERERRAHAAARAEWEAVRAINAAASLDRCDTGEAAHIARLLTVVPSLLGVWHAAGVLADALLHKQDASGQSYVFAPKAHGAQSVHATSISASMHTFAS